MIDGSDHETDSTSVGSTSHHDEEKKVAVDVKQA
jgi:hypothetical protein